MKDRIRSSILLGHSSIINGINIDKATIKVENLFKEELEIIFEMILSSDDPYDLVYKLKRDYGIEG